MNITIRNLKTMPTMDFPAVYCHVYLDGKMVGIFHDDGNGGEPDFQTHPYNDANLKKVASIEAYAKSLPPVNINANGEFGDDKPRMFQPDFNWLIDNAINEKLREKERAKFLKDCKIGVVYGKSDTNYSMTYWKKMTLEAMRLMPRGTDTVQNAIDTLKENGKNILNAEYLKSLGWKV